MLRGVTVGRRPAASRPFCGPRVMEELPAHISSPSYVCRWICDLRLGSSARLMGLDPFCCFSGERERERERGVCFVK